MEPVAAAPAATGGREAAPPCDPSGDRICISTAINYANGAPHMGHAYEAVSADVIARYHRAFGRQVCRSCLVAQHTAPVGRLTPGGAGCSGFVHDGRRRARTEDRRDREAARPCAQGAVRPVRVAVSGARHAPAARRGRALPDLHPSGLTLTVHGGLLCEQKLNERLSISNDVYNRTTSAKHRECCQLMFRRSMAAGDVYLGSYEGWCVEEPQFGGARFSDAAPATRRRYNVREETFVTETEAAAADYKDPVSGKPLEKMRESSYFFKQSRCVIAPPLAGSRRSHDCCMGRYQDRLIEHIKANPDFIKPEARRHDILLRLQREPLLDLSISRTTFDWGIPVPDDPAHVMCAPGAHPRTAPLWAFGFVCAGLTPRCGPGMCGSMRSRIILRAVTGQTANAAPFGRRLCTSLVRA